MPTFSILVITYNRHDLLEECLKSIEDQSFKDFEVYVLDRGSIPSAKNIVEKFDNRFKYIQSSQEVHIVDGANEIINKLQGEIFFHLADDDVICKNTLQEVYNALKNNQECDVAQVGLIGYDYLLDKNNINWEHFSRHSKYNFNNKEPHITIIEGKTSCQLEWQCSNVLINTRIKINQPFTRLHPSCLFFRLHKLKEVCKLQKGIFIKPMWDIGTAALIYRTKIAYINKPLAIVSENSPNRESLSNRTRWGKEPISLVPLYVPSIDSCFVETILKVIETNKLLSNNEYIHIHPEYYFNLLNTIMQDNPITETTRHDFIKVNLKIFTLSIFSPNIIIKLYLANFKKIRKFIKRFIKKATLYNRITDTNKNFYTITEYREFIENYFEN